ncbi:tetratricopeptide repeat protein [Salegentibacter chungangensis]|uniref:Tetratricopeptide repeat protein n=1 Tax=Salegentibacter chungangensis TaxID=1335724 RepID=A0ABW3NPL9_9FLAO
MRGFLFICAFLFAGFGSFAQSDQLAKNFLEKGEYEKALKTYQELAKENPGNPVFFYGMVAAYQQLEDFKAAEDLLREKLQNTANNPNILIEIGHNFELQDKLEMAGKFYEEALSVIEARPNYAYGIARGFEKYNLLDYAARSYERGMILSPDRNYNLQLARIYGEQGKIEEMFQSYLDLIDADPKFFEIANREFARYITEDGESEPNTIFRKLVLKKMQNNPSILYNEMLSWLFVQQKEFSKAFAQEKAIYKRQEPGLMDAGGLQAILNLAVIAKNEGDKAAAKEIVEYVIEETPSETTVLQGRQFLMNLKSEMADASNLKEVDDEYREILNEFGYDLKTFLLQIDYAKFLAFKMDDPTRAEEILKQLVEKTESNFQKAIAKMALADILVLQEKFNEALIYFSQVQHLVKNNELAQSARFKVAKTSYYKGDFAWAKTQLDILKSSTSQLIANDAMELSLLIEDNSIEDSTQVALKKYARADLLAFQERNQEAIDILSEILLNHKGESIEDEALLKQAKLYTAEGDFRKAEANYLKIIEFFGDDILADNATYFLAELYAHQLELPEKAKQYYEQIIFNFADSIYFVEARKSFRRLRGDAIE